MDYDELQQKYSAVLRRIATGYAPPGAEREDLLQEMALAVHVAMPAFRSEAKASTYVYRIAQNCGVDYLRKRREVPLDPAVADRLASDDSPEAQTSQRQRQERLGSAIRRLPLGLRQPLLLRLEGHSYEQIAEVLDLSTSNVGVRLHRATQALKKELDP